MWGVEALTDGEGDEAGTVNWTVAEARFYKASEAGGDNDNSDASTPEKPETPPEKPVENKVVENTAGGKAYYAVIGTEAVTFSEARHRCVRCPVHYGRDCRRRQL